MLAQGKAQKAPGLECKEFHQSAQMSLWLLALGACLVVAQLQVGTVVPGSTVATRFTPSPGQSVTALALSNEHGSSGVCLGKNGNK